MFIAVDAPSGLASAYISVHWLTEQSSSPEELHFSITSFSIQPFLFSMLFFPKGMMLAITDVSRHLRVYNHVIYCWILEDAFPQPCANFNGAYRWSSDKVNNWMNKKRIRTSSLAASAEPQVQLGIINLPVGLA